MWPVMVCARFSGAGRSHDAGGRRIGRVDVSDASGSPSGALDPAPPVQARAVEVAETSAAIAPGTAHSAAASPGGLSVGTPGSGRRKPVSSAPASAARKAPMIPPQNLSGTSTAKCQRAIPTMIQTATLIEDQADSRVAVAQWALLCNRARSGLEAVSYVVAVPTESAHRDGPVLLCYDGSDLARAMIEQSVAVLGGGRRLW